MMSHNCYQTLSNITYKIRHQTCDDSYMTADVCCHITVITVNRR